ncbi:hypothetical protein DFH09DRAFT_1115491 [Mycena vulgaris]|nr:hypothetical protein DFH09DRAFT_1115491 [Mycena vulgaris]
MTRARDPKRARAQVHSNYTLLHITERSTCTAQRNTSVIRVAGSIENTMKVRLKPRGLTVRRGCNPMWEIFKSRGVSQLSLVNEESVGSDKTGKDGMMSHVPHLLLLRPSTSIHRWSACIGFLRWPLLIPFLPPLPSPSPRGLCTFFGFFVWFLVHSRQTDGRASLDGIDPRSHQGASDLRLQELLR